jgi:O-antigen/teichoic acid export membrane protein
MMVAARAAQSMHALIRFVERKLTTGRLVRSMLLVSVGHVVGGLVLVATAPAISRLYAPSDLGVLAVYTPLLSVLGVLATLRYEAAIVLPRDERDSRQLVALCILLSTVIPLGLGGCLWCFDERFSSLSWLAAVQPYWGVFLANLCVFGLYQGVAFWAIRQGAFGRLAALRITYSVAMGVTPILFGVFLGGAFGLLLGSVFGYGCAVLSLLTSRGRQAGWMDGISLSRMRALAVRYRRFPLYSTFSTALSRVNGLLPPLLLATLYGLEVAGWYALAQRVVATPLTALSNPVSRVYFSEAARIHRQGGGSLHELLFKTISWMAVLLLAPLGVLAILSPYGFAVVFGLAWGEAGVFCRILIPMLFFQMVSFVVSPTLEVLERQSLYLAASSFLALLSGGSIPLCYLAGLSARSTLMVHSAAAIAGFLLLIGLAWWHAARQTTVPDLPEQQVPRRKAA